jgi:S-adenosylmethionine synthetase
MGAGISPTGEVKTKSKLHQNQIAATIVKLLGYNYNPDHFYGKAIEGIIGR